MAKIFAPMADLGAQADLGQEPAPEDVAALDSALGDPEPTPLEEGSGLQALEDGSYLVLDPEEAQDAPELEFDANLADGLLSPETLSRLGPELVELIESDKEARTERDKQYADGIKRTGLTKAKVGADFDGASGVTHPMLARGCVDFASKAVKELLPSGGPVRTQIMGEQTEAKLERAERKKAYMNWQLTEKIPEHRPEFEKMLSQLPLGGSQYKRWWYDSRLGRPRTAAVYIDDIFLPFDQNDFYTTPRLTHREFLGVTEFEERVSSGLYLYEGSTQGDQPERSQAAEAARQVEGVNDEGAFYNKTGGTREVFTVYVQLDLEEDPEADGPAPYIVHVDEQTERVLGVYRNWAQEDPLRLRLHWIVEYVFLPWRGAYGVGLAHLIGGMSVSATGALNALLDASHISNFPGGLKLKAGRTSGQNVAVNPTELAEIDAPPGVDDIRKLVRAFPFNGPSAVLYNLLEWLTAQAEMVVSTASEKIADGGANMPMGTALALIEGGATNFSAIHARLHHSLRKELEIVHRLDATYLEDSVTVAELGDLVVHREDFRGPMDVLPVSDPNIFSEAQRYAQLQAVMQLAGAPQFAPLFKPERLLLRAFRLLQVPYAEEIAHLPRDPQRLPPVRENAAAADPEGAPLKVYEEQDDLSHLISHVTFMTSPLLGASPLIGPLALPKLLKHCQEHLVNFYRKNHEAATRALSTIAAAQGLALPPAQAEQQGHAFADQAIAQALAPVVAPGLQAAQQLAAQFAPKPPADGNTLADIASREKLEGLKLQQQAQEADKERAHRLQELKIKLDAEAAQKDQDRAMNRDAATMATAIEHMQVQAETRLGQLTLMVEALKTDTLEQNKIYMAELKAANDQALTVLKQLLLDRAPPPPPVDVEGAVAPAVAGVQSVQAKNTELEALINAHIANMTQTLQSVMGSINAVEALARAPRVAEYTKDANGRVTGARSTVADQSTEVPLPGRQQP